jgi:two-component system CheB/CheR fusion protein
VSARASVVGLGASAGGIDALRQFFTHLPDAPESVGVRMVYVVVTHLSSEADSSLVDILQRSTRLVVEEATDGQAVTPGHVYVIPPGRRLAIEDGHLHVSDAPRPHQTTTIDRFFRSLAADQGNKAIGIVLSGMGTDGSIGLRSIKEAGGITMVQDPAEAEYSHMPQSALNAAQVDLSLPVPDLSEKLVEYCDNAGSIHVPVKMERMSTDGRSAFQHILSRLQSEAGHDFSRYKRSSLLRRIRRRMQIHSHPSLEAYLKHLRDDLAETRALYRDLLIGVTSFFRAPAAFEALSEAVIPTLFEHASVAEPVRVWVPGCATGEEAYSLAILLAEHADTLDHPPDVQIFATDVDQQALQFARSGLYPAPIETDLTPERLERFFNEEGDYYRVAHTLREQVLFARHNLLVDPPFCNLDLISCRNLLIYLNEETQKYALELFHFGLKQKKGTLLLGGAESTRHASPLFSIADESHSILQAKARRPKGGYSFATGDWDMKSGLEANSALEKSRLLIQENTRDATDDGDQSYRDQLISLLRRRILSREVPSLLVDARHTILDRNEAARPYLQLEGRGRSPRLDDCVPETLGSVLETVLADAAAKGEPVRRSDVTVPMGNDEQTLTVAVYPIVSDGTADELTPSSDQSEAFPLLVRFERSSLPASSPGEATGNELQEELRRLRAQLLLTIQGQDAPEDLEAANEELLSMNEELHVMNEELHTKNHELATRREELKATNEELKATNQQLREKMEEIEETNSALETLMAATQITTFFLDQHLRLQRYTPRNTDLFDVRPTDVGRPLSYLARQLNYDGLLEDARQVLETGQTLDREIRPDEETWLLTRIRPYSQSGDHGDGVVLTFVDVTSHRALERELVSTAEKVRREIGQELHDVLSSDLAAIAMKTENIARRLAENGSEETDALQAVVESMRAASTKSRTLSHELIPVGLQEEHLAAALESLCNEQEDLSGLPCVFLGNREEPLPKSKETAMQLYRIGREAIVNARKHASPNEIQVDLRRREDNLVLRVRDDGKGLPDNLDEAEGLGIRTMRYRANLIGTSLTFETGKGGTTVVRCALPLNAARSE